VTAISAQRRFNALLDDGHFVDIEPVIRDPEDSFFITDQNRLAEPLL
jgi:hypothetical protein